MSDYGFLVTSQQQTPTTVMVDFEDGALLLRNSVGTEAIPIGQLRKLSDTGTQLQFGRRGNRKWRLTLSGPLVQELRSRVSSRGPLLRWGVARTWHVVIFIATLLIVELVKIPATWLAPIIPPAIERRLVAQDVRGYYGTYCNSPEGELALRSLVARLDPSIARSVKMEVVNGEGFIVTAVPGNRLIVSNAFLTTTTADVFAALLAHEVAHLQQNDDVTAALRANGTFGALIGTLFGSRRPDNALEFSNKEEWSADVRAIEMLRRARISTLPGADLFARIEKERDANRSFGKEQYYLHWGMGEVRAQRWRDAQDKSERLQTRPSLSQEQADALFNYCWRHQGPPRHPLPTIEQIRDKG